jgi:hypothetical protein
MILRTFAFIFNVIMAKPEIIAWNVLSLNEARYFAAMGVDWLCFNSLHFSPNELNSITDWVVGPRYAIDLHEEEPDYLFELTSKVKIDGVCIKENLKVPEWYNGQIITEKGWPTESEHKTGEIWFFRNIREIDSTILNQSFLQPYWIELQSEYVHPALIVPDGVVINCELHRIQGEPDYASLDKILEEMID